MKNDKLSAMVGFRTLGLAIATGGLGVAAWADEAASSTVAAPVTTPSLTQAPSLASVPAIHQAGGFLDNPYGLQALWAQGDWVSRLTLGLLFIMSLGSWYVLIARTLDQVRFGRYALQAQLHFWNASDVRQAVSRLSAKSPFRFIAQSGLDANQHHEGLLHRVDFNTWLTQNIQDAVAQVQSQSQNGLAVLATVGSTAPFVGLFGTVWGIYNALVKIGATGQASIDRVAGPVGEALIMTALGLAVAVPAVLGYNWLVRRNKLGMDKIKVFGSRLHTVLLSTEPAAMTPSEAVAPAQAQQAAAS